VTFFYDYAKVNSTGIKKTLLNVNLLAKRKWTSECLRSVFSKASLLKEAKACHGAQLRYRRRTRLFGSPLATVSLVCVTLQRCAQVPQGHCSAIGDGASGYSNCEVNRSSAAFTSASSLRSSSICSCSELWAAGGGGSVADSCAAGWD